MLKIKDLSIKYNDFTAVKNFNLDLKAGQVVSIVGESGSGKTTVLRSIIGEISKPGRIDSGEILYKGRSIGKMSQAELQEIRGPEIAMIFQDAKGFLDPIEKLGKQFYEYISTHRDVDKKTADQMTLDALKKMNLRNPEEILNSFPSNLSGGMIQRVGIAMGILLSPSLLLADEPTSALDLTSQARIIYELKAIAEELNTSIVMVTHNLGVASFISDYIMVMKDGDVVCEGDYEAVIENSQEPYTRKLIGAVPKLRGKRYV